jgi:hypothetical protein
MKSNTLFLIFSFPLLFACENPIEVDLNSADPKIVIEGALANVPGEYMVKWSNRVFQRLFSNIKSSCYTIKPSCSFRLHNQIILLPFPAPNPADAESERATICLHPRMGFSHAPCCWYTIP